MRTTSSSITNAQLHLEDVREAMTDPALAGRVATIIEELSAIDTEVELQLSPDPTQ